MTRMQAILSGELNPRRLAGFGRQIADLIQRAVAEPEISAAAEAANAREVTVQLRDRSGAPVVGRWPVLIWITGTKDGPPDATGIAAILLVTGYELQAGASDEWFAVLTDETGKAVVRYTIAGSATRYVYAVALCGGEALGSGALTWA